MLEISWLKTTIVSALNDEVNFSSHDGIFCFLATEAWSVINIIVVMFASFIWHEKCYSML